MQATQNLKTCSRCWRELPVEVFRYQNRVSGERHAECNRCHADGEKRRRDQKRLSRIDRFNKAIVAESDARRMSRIVAEMIDSYGGMGGFVEAWRAATETASARGRSCSVMRTYRVVFELLAASGELARKADQATSEDIAGMGREELVQAQLRAAMDLIRDRPQIAVAAAVRLGWDVRPPVEDHDD